MSGTPLGEMGDSRQEDQQDGDPYTLCDGRTFFLQEHGGGWSGRGDARSLLMRCLESESHVEVRVST